MKNLLIKELDAQEHIILGVDPGTRIMGFGLIKSKRSDMEFIGMDELLLEKTSGHNLRLKKIFKKTLSLIDEFLPDELAIEAPFLGKNVQSMLKLGRAQGVTMAAGLHREIPITEYSARKIKMSITGNGNASKEQVAGMLRHLLSLQKEPSIHLDASDGLAAAVCHHLNKSMVKGMKRSSYQGWTSFVKENTERLSG
ncbi:crossover junction endodeoxyribonuclease RuvC [Bacteroidetes bacterium endosymbiont of Geopemphigus sp.]|uniref:crossover junction endodeoxyribonuclease RuvC n=1 Tax=Bacteroidetes bacterium endosymbiont of Geopemphigus sp. TaxID=2047937 RepID=UPI000CD077E7|nr:crossover junction endodeoxyribonuclease RuvC [Bacteroidetes bacterium endosymbiont of Geopemphigus sp.]